jgi:hypothetical protein
MNADPPSSGATALKVAIIATLGGPLNPQAFFLSDTLC